PRSDSFFGLIQELVAPSVFRLLVVTCLLNQTRGKVAIPAFWSLLARYPDAVALSEANLEELSSMLQPLGLHNVRAKRLIEMSKKFVEAPPMEDKVFKSRAKDCPPTPINHYPGVGRYAVDSYRIFIADGGSQVAFPKENAADEDQPEWKKVMPLDKELRAYLIWRWAKAGIEWD
ncbi:DNA glycosylase, partial [Violaceomyces palustris]